MITYLKRVYICIRINSPTQTSIKFWIGNLGRTSTLGIFWAQLITPDGVNHGPHAFIAHIRDTENHMPVAGCDIGDCGYKLGANNLDNGWIRFSNFRIPRAALLNKYGDVDASGNYLTNVEDDKKRFGLQFSSLSGGRCMISRIAVDFSFPVIVTAMRYCCVRKAFGEPE